jgi:HEPN superfamily RiboL-PSP-like protein
MGATPGRNEHALSPEASGLGPPLLDEQPVESNLKPVVLRKILFRLGFPPETFASHEGTIHRLVNRRNNIAHGLSAAVLTPLSTVAWKRSLRKS